MINWSTIKDLHVVKKLDQIIGKWFSVDNIFINEFGKIQHDLKHKDHKFHDNFFKTFIQSASGFDVFQAD